MLCSIWGLLYPVFLYELLSAIAVMLVFRIPGISEANASLLVIPVNTLLIAPILFWLHIQDDRKWGERSDRTDILPMELYYLIWAVSSCAAMAFLGNVAISLTPLMEVSDRFWETQEILTSGNIVLQIFATVAAAPVLEELLVRGVLYPRMRRLFGIKAGIALSALLFAILHGNLVQGVYAFVLGAYFAWLMERFDNIWVPILGHMSANLFVTLMGYEHFSGYIFGSGMSFILELIVCAGCVGRAVQILRVKNI